MTNINYARNMAGTPLWMLPKAILRACKSKKTEARKKRQKQYNNKIGKT